MASWVEAANSEGTESAKMQSGWYRAKVAKVLRHKGKGDEREEFATSKGPYMILVYDNDAGEEATQSVWLTEKAKWKFAKVLSRLGVDLEKMDAAGVTIDHFKNEEYANKALAGRTTIIKADEDGKYVNAEPHHDAEVPVEVLRRLNTLATSAAAEQQATPTPASTAEQPLSDEDIPF